MRIPLYVVLLLMVVLQPIMAQDPPAAPAATPGFDWVGMAKSAANSPVGLFILSAAFTWLAGWVIRKNPKAVELVLTYKPTLLTAVREAEKAIPDNTPNSAMAKADAALKWLLANAEGPIVKAKEADLRKALDLAYQEDLKLKAQKAELT